MVIITKTPKLVYMSKGLSFDLFHSGCKMGKYWHDRGREKTTSKCLTWLLQPTFCSSLRDMYTSVQLLHYLCLSHEFNKKLCGSLKSDRCRGRMGTLQFQNEATYYTWSLAKGLTMVSNQSSSSHWNHLWWPIFSIIQELLYSVLLWGWALFTHFC